MGHAQGESSVGKSRAKAEEVPTAHVIVWACMVVAIAATVYFILREPEEGVATVLDQHMLWARTLAVAGSFAGGAVGVWRVLTRGGGPELFGMAVLFNIIVACFWVLRIALTP